MTVVGGRVEHEIIIEAPAHFVFTFFTDPTRHAAWLGMKAELDPRPGGLYRCVVNGSATVVGEYVEVSPPERVVFTWGFEGNDDIPPGSSTVSITLRADGPRTVVRLVHTGLPHPSIAPHDVGWSGYLSALATAATAGWTPALP